MTSKDRSFVRTAKLWRFISRRAGGVSKAVELINANLELATLRTEQAHRASELVVANKELVFQNTEKTKRAYELHVANEKLDIQTQEKAERASELIVAKKELVFQQEEKGKRAAELLFARKELAFQEEKSLLQAQLQKSQKLESLGTLAGGVAHDMNNVLGAILGLASAHLELQPKDSTAYLAFETITKAAVRGGKLVKTLLTFARQSPAENLPVDMNTILQEDIRLLECTVLSKVCLEVILEPELRPICGDAAALTHALMNLCVNAVDAMPERGALRLRTRNVDEDWIEVAVEDTGTGMTKEVQERALDPFFSTKGIGKGTGLGLSMVYATVMAHHGLLEIQSEPGQGTCISLRFPTSGPQLRVAQPKAEPLPAVQPRSLTVLVVDDDELIQSSMQAILDLLGHTVITASSGKEAVAKLEARFEPDLIILDMNMPGLDGGETLPLLRSLRPSVPVLLATGRTDQAALDLIAANTDVTLLAKPFSAAELKQYLGSLG
jgi:signal transduction histidine kinase/CheY-like chemotaxis protein